MVLGLAAALGLGKRRILDESPLLMSALAGLIVSASGLAFQIFFRDTTPVPTYLLRVLLGALSARLPQFGKELFLAALKAAFPEKLHAANEAMFELGRGC